MTSSKHFSRWRSAAGLVSALMLAVACDDTRTPMTPPTPASALTIGLDVSSLTAAPGARVAVAVRAAGQLAEPLQGLQGYVRFDPARLTYLGQAAGTSLVLVNAHQAAAGSVRLISVEPRGLAARTAVLIFAVKGGDYTRGLRYEFERAASRRFEFDRAASGAVAEATDLVAGDAVTLTAEDWCRVLMPGQYAARHGAIFPTPGQYRANLQYGDATLDGTINVLDVVYLSNISVGNVALIDATNRDAVIAGNVRPINGGTGGTPRPGVEPGTATPDGQINVTDVVAISNESVGFLVAVVGDVIPGRGPTQVPPDRVVINANITADRVFKKDTVYQIGDANVANVSVTNNATLTIEPGTRIEGWYGTGVFGGGGVGQGQGTLFIQRDGRIVADGTALEPIVFTCVLPPFTGPRNEPPNTRWPGCWGGLIISGNATINADSPTSGVNPANGTRSTAGCVQEQDESDPGTLYGGCNDADSSGVLRYVRSEYGGARFTVTKERNGITFNGVGNHTLVDYIQAHGSLDDGTEYFGGTVNIKHVVLTGNEDDNIDWVLGWRGSGQFIIQQSDSMDGDRCVEADNNGIDGGNPDRTPRSNPTIFNITCVGKAQPFRYTSTTGLPTTCHTQLNSSAAPQPNCVNQAFIFRQNTNGMVRNAIAYRFAVGLDFDQPAGTGITLSPTGICDAVAAGILRNAVVSLGPTATPPPGATGATISVGPDPDGNDPGVSGATTSACGPYAPPTFNGSNLEALYMADPANNITVFNNDDANGDYLVNPLDVVAPDFRPKAGSAPTTLPVAANPGTINGFTFEDAPYLGAVAPVNGGNIPWYAGWTRGWTTATQK
jgi:hypothetical protein